MQSTLSIPLGTLIFVLILSGCDFPGGTKEDGPAPSQTRILEVRVDPNHISVSDTVTFTAIIRDSLNAGFRFKWFIGIPATPVTEENSIQWVADVEPGRYFFLVEADNGDPNGRPANESFTVEVAK